MPNFDWTTKYNKVKELTRKEFHSLQIVSNAGNQTLYHLPSTGEYLRSVDNSRTLYEVMYTPYSNGKRTDTVFMDDVETPKDEGMKTWWDTLITTNTNKTEPKPTTYKSFLDAYSKLYEQRASEIYSQFEKMFLYGTPPKKSIWEKKEKKMEIGGHNCHLCGAEILQENRDTVYKKKQHLRVVNRYQCGTIVEKSWKSRGDGYAMENHSQKVILGDDCVEI